MPSFTICSGASARLPPSTASSSPQRTPVHAAKTFITKSWLGRLIGSLRARLSVGGARIVGVELKGDGEVGSPFATAWAAVEAARAASASLNGQWNQLEAEQAFCPIVDVDADGHGRIDVHCAWPHQIRQAVESAAASFVEALSSAFDSAVLATAQVNCMGIGELDAAQHQMLYSGNRQEFWQAVQGGHYTGLRPDQVGLIEAFLPLDDPGIEGTESPAAGVVRGAMRHFRNMQMSSSGFGDSLRIAIWAHSAEPEIFVDPPGKVLSVDSTGDGVLAEVRTVATFRVDRSHGQLNVRGNPNVAFDVIANSPPWPTDPNDNFGARSSLLFAVASEFIRGCERSVKMREFLGERPLPSSRVVSPAGPTWAPVRLHEDDDLQTMMSQSDIGLAAYRNDDGEFVMLVQVSDTVYGRPIPPALLLDPSQLQGTAAEDAAIDAASMWGLPDFVFRPRVISKGRAQRELGDATIITGAKALAVQVKSREGAVKDTNREAQWLTKKAIGGARQAAGTVRTLRASPAELTNGRGRTVTCDGDRLAWVGVVVLDHPNAPEDISPPKFDVGIPVVAMLRRDWDFLFDQLRSVSAVVDYLHRVAGEPSVAIGEEPVRYFELAHADEHAPPRPAAWIDRMGATAARTTSPILPKAPASAADAAGHTFFRILLEDIAESAFDGEEEDRLQILAKLDRFSVGKRAELGRLLMERLDAVTTVPAGTTRWHHRLIAQDENELHLFFSVASHFTETHREVYKGWVLLRRQEFMEIADTDTISPPWTVGVLLTPCYDGYRAWDTTLIATCDEIHLDDAERTRLSALWNDPPNERST
jgi:hypothetical protein